MNISHLENKLKDIAQYDSQIDSVDVWNQLVPRLKKKESNRKLFLLWFGCIGILSIGIVYMLASYVDQNTNEINSQNYISFDNSNQKANQKLVQNEDENDEKNTKLVRAGSEHSSIAISPDSSVENKAIGSDARIKNVNYTEYSSKQPILHAISSETSSGTMVAKQTNSNSINIYFKVEERNRAKGLEFQNDVTSSNSSSSRGNSNKRPSPSEIEPLNSELGFKFLTAYDTLSKGRIRASVPELDGCPIITKSTKPIRFSLRPYVGWSQVNHQFKNKAELTNFHSLRESSESNYFAYDWGVDAVFTSPIGISLTTGFNYTNIIDKFEFQIEKDTVYLFKDVIKSIVINENQDSVITIGDTLVFARVIENNTLFNSYKFIDIPIGFELSKRVNRFEIGIAAKALINIALRTSGKLYAEDESIISLNSENIYKQRIGLRFNFAAPIQYHFNQQFSIGVAPSFYYNPTSLTLPQYNLEHKFTLSSIYLFAGYHF